MSLDTLYKEEKIKRSPLKTFKVASRTNFNPDLGKFEEYEVELWADGEIICPCWAGGYKRPCWHKKYIKAKLEKEFGSIINAINYYKNYDISDTKRC